MESVKCFGIEVNFLTGRFVATFHNDRRQHEWPPHPARLFSALVAAWAEEEKPNQLEREALEWLESQPFSEVVASKAFPRKALSNFVPINDSAVIDSRWYEKKSKKVFDLIAQLDDQISTSNGNLTRKADQLKRKLAKEKDVTKQVTDIGSKNQKMAQKMLPDYRPKQERFYPSVTPEDPRAVFLWNVVIPKNIAKTLDFLLQRVTRLGHSSSFVACRLVSNNTISNKGDTYRGKLRIVRSGQLADLEQQYYQHQGVKPRSLPYTIIRNTSILDTPSELNGSLRPNNAGEWIVFEFVSGSRFFPITRVVELATAMRAAILHHAVEPIPEEVSGHFPDGKPTSRPHIAFIPIPYVGFEHSDGRLMGIAISLPNSINEAARRTLYRAIGHWEAISKKDMLKLTFGTKGVSYLRRQRSHATLVSLRSNVWNKPAHRWISVTPIALPRHPGKLSSGTVAQQTKAWKMAESWVALACTHIGLPAPLSVEISIGPIIKGTQSVSHYPIFSQNSHSGKPLRRQLVHASVVFENLVEGPFLLGTGRFVGLGLMRPNPFTDAENSRNEN